jgi:hypothetical protein
MRWVLICLVATGLAHGQAPRIASIDFYGLRKVPVSKLRQALGAKEGDPLLASKADAEARIEKVDGVVLARLEAVCCEAGGAILFVGVEEKGSLHFDYRTPPEGSAPLPETVADAYRRFLEAYEASARSAEPREDLTHGYALAADPDVRALQQGFLELAEANFAKLRQTLRESADPEERAAAAYVIGYAPDKRSVALELQYALQDSDEGVRRNAMRGLAALAVLAARSPDSQIKIEPTWLIEMLNSVLWGDRTRAAALLATLTESRDAGVLEQMRERALPAIVEMARWNSLTYALPAYVLAGRLAGLTEKEIQDTWSKGERETTLARIASPAKAGK